ncbi:dihydroorotase/allantoinase [Murinocardiopsis flavida]|uniref:Dihydroorotase/allantoinase n=1 Tax=Murinocardiopsis flavida TaxID=645275 RepID=A0A2P8DGR8_9ACTN|nr:amidohydrolase family protein [Murinocardiopsis flavida]PSK96412.1 dihydroorotase/allantoinase [Murinocardiopsis flavida]
MRHFDLVVRSQRVVTPDGIVPAAVGVTAGVIAAITGYDAPLEAFHATDLGAAALLPGGVDLDVGVQSPGQDLADAYAATTAAAAAGGTTTMVVTPAPARPALTEAAALRRHLRAARGNSSTHVAFLGGITGRSTPADLAELRGAGVVGFHCSLSDGGAPDMGAVHEAQLRKTMGELAAMDATLVVHPEDAAEIAVPVRGGNGALLSSRPPRAERRGLERVISAARVTGTRAHISPFTAAECAAVLAAARSIGIPVSAQTCPHYLCMPAERVPDHSPAFQCRPPLRSNANRLALWSALLDDSIVDCVGSGHRPGTGVSVVSWTLPAMWTAATRRGCDLTALARWTAERPADIVGLGAKGRIAVGRDADLVGFDPDAKHQVADTDPGPYAGLRLTGRVTATWVAGRRITAADAGPTVHGTPLLPATS